MAVPSGRYPAQNQTLSRLHLLRVLRASHTVALRQSMARLCSHVWTMGAVLYRESDCLADLDAPQAPLKMESRPEPSAQRLIRA